MKIVSMECPNCCAPLKIDQRRRRAVCEHCGSTFYLDDESRIVMPGQETGEENKTTEIHRTGGAGGGKKKRRTWLWVLGWIFLPAIPATVLLARAKKLPKWLRGVLIALVWLLWWFILFGREAKKEIATYQWEEILLHEKLPKPASDVGEISYNYDDSFHLYVRKTSGADYMAYRSACVDAGYTIDSTRDSQGIDAFNEEGYHLDLWYYEEEKEMSIQLRAPMPMGTLRWPTSDLARLLPVPESTVGKISWEGPSGLSVYVGDTPYEKYSEYVDAVRDSGFSKNYSRSDHYFHGENESGVRVSVSYEGFSVMYIYANMPESDGTPIPSTEAESLPDVVPLPEDETTGETEQESQTETERLTQETTEAQTESQTESQTETESAGETGEIREDLKTFLEEYEAFVDEYSAFLEKYFSSDKPADLLEDYMKYMVAFVDQSAKAEKWSRENLTEAELKAYTEVMVRCTGKLAKLQDEETSE